jgi:hypothetical protein
MTVKVNFASILPGLLVFLVGVGLFVLFLFMAVFSFFIFFLPFLHGFFYVTLGVPVGSLVLMGPGLSSLCRWEGVGSS